MKDRYFLLINERTGQIISAGSKEFLTNKVIPHIAQTENYGLFRIWGEEPDVHYDCGARTFVIREAEYEADYFRFSLVPTLEYSYKDFQ